MAATTTSQGAGSAQATAQSPAAPQAPATPPIPAVPARPGAATGAVATTQSGPVAAPDAAAEPGQSVQGEGGAPQAIIIQPPPYRSEGRNNDIPREVIPIIGMVMGTLMALALLYPVVRMITRVIERRADKSYVRGADVEVQLRALQESVDTMAIEIERISESQRFQSKLLAERKAGVLPPG